jgi:hypothetical protein
LVKVPQPVQAATGLGLGISMRRHNIYQYARLLKAGGDSLETKRPGESLDLERAQKVSEDLVADVLEHKHATMTGGTYASPEATRRAADFPLSPHRP